MPEASCGEADLALRKVKAAAEAQGLSRETKGSLQASF